MTDHPRYASSTFVCAECGYTVHRYAIAAERPPTMCATCQYLNDDPNLTDRERVALRARLSPPGESR